MNNKISVMHLDRKQRKASAFMATSSIRSIFIVALFMKLACQLVNTSPPIDFFLYTSEKSDSLPHRSLPTLDSIYSTGNDKAQLAEKVLKVMQNVSHTHDNDMIDMDTTRYAWFLMERQALIYMRNRLDNMMPVVRNFLNESKVSVECGKAINDWLKHLYNLDYWASKMWNSWGEFPPSGLFEGSFTDLGSYRGCMSIEDNILIGQAQYCTLDFQPLVPTRPRFHSIFKKILDVEPISGRINGGDFSKIKVNSQHTAHGFSSSMFFPIEDSLVTHNNHTDRVSAQPETGFSISNFTLKSEAMIEFIRRAHYFYYVKFRLGACLPSKCTRDDVQKLAQTAGQVAVLQANPVNCLTKDPILMNNHQRFAIWILSIFALIAVLATVLDLLGFEADNNSRLVVWLLPFSIWTNSKKLFDSGSAGTHGDLECVHGLRFFSMIWVIYGHTILYTEYQSYTHFFNMIETQVPSFLMLPTLNANFSVDTFFVISGILTTYVTWEYTKGDSRKFNKFAFAISRYIRLTPQLAIVILCFFLLPLMGDGPMYKQVAEDKADACYENWPINLLYLQSYISDGKPCIDPSWWLSIEMTFHLISLAVILVMIKNPMKGMQVNFMIAAVLTLWGTAIHYTNGFAIQYLPSIPQRYEVTTEQTKLFFHRPYPHAASYFIGIALGYVLANRTIKKLSKAQLYQGWFVCMLGIVISLWGSHYWNLGAAYTQLQATIYYHICQIMWPISISWIILACSLGHGGVVNKILSAKLFVPLGRVTYMTYLSHALIIYYHTASTSIPAEPTFLLFIYAFIANTFLSLILGVLLTVVYESPILNLQKSLFSYLTSKFDPSAENQLRELPQSDIHDKNVPSRANLLLLPGSDDGPMEKTKALSKSQIFIGLTQP